MLKLTSRNKKFILSTVITLTLLVIGLLGGSWDQAFATTTIPIADSITPNQIDVGSPDTQFLIEGSDFIGEWSTEWTLIRWEGPDGQVVEVEPDFVSDDGTKIFVTFTSSLFNHSGAAEIVIINHPEDLLLRQESAPLYVDIIGYIYLPLIMK